MDPIGFNVERVHWKIGTGKGKSKSLYLYRRIDNDVYKVAKFCNPIEAEEFALNFDYPISDEVWDIIDEYRKGREDDERRT